MSIRRRFASVTVLVCLSALAAAQQPAQDQPQTFRSRITIVPVDEEGHLNRLTHTTKLGW